MKKTIYTCDWCGREWDTDITLTEILGEDICYACKSKLKNKIEELKEEIGVFMGRKRKP